MKIWIIVALSVISLNVHSQELVTEFKTDSDEKAAVWSHSPEGAGYVDTSVLYEGKNSFKLQRTVDSPEGTHFVLQRIPLNIDGEVLELRAMLKARGTGPWAGINIMLRQDLDRNAIEFTNSQPFVTGKDTDWHPVRVVQKINPHADSLVFGSVLVGPGEGWVSDIQLWVDGERVTEIPEQLQSGGTASSDIAKLNEIDLSGSEDATLLDVAEFIRVWGFLKYFHPNVARGEWDWDAMLLEKVHSLTEGEELDSALTALLSEIGVPEGMDDPEESYKDTEIAKIDIQGYFKAANFNTEITTALNTIHDNRHTFGESRYAFADNMELPSFAGEGRYHAEYSDQTLQLIAVARLWNIIEYWFPYRHELKADWHGELDNSVMQIAKAPSRAEFLSLIHGLLAKLEDGHAVISGSMFRNGECRLPFTLRYIEEQVVISHINAELPKEINLGDEVIAIDGVRVDESLEQGLPFYPASNESHRYYYLANDLISRSCSGPATILTLRRNGAEYDIQVADYIDDAAHATHSLPGNSVQDLTSDVTYVKLAGLDFDGVNEAISKAEKTGKLIIDARGYPDEFVLYSLGGRLTDKPLPFAQLAWVASETPGVVTMSDYVPALEPDEPLELEGIVILVDETTFSQPEFSVLAWRELPNTTVIGSTTAGAVGNIRSVTLPYGLTAWFTGLRVLDNEGNDVQHVGIIPDVYLKPSIEDVRSGRDVLVDEAIKILD